MLSRVQELFPLANEVRTSVEYKDALGARYHAGDVALLCGPRMGQCGLIWYHFDVNGVEWTCLALWKRVRMHGDRNCEYAILEEPCHVPTAELFCTAIYRVLGTRALVMQPLAYRML